MKNSRDTKQRTNVGDDIQAIAKKGDYYLSDRSEPFVDLNINGKRITCEVRSKQFYDWLRSEYNKTHGQILSRVTLQNAVETISANTSMNQRPKIKVWRRVAEHEGCIYIDLCNDDYQIIEVGSHGWSVITNPPLRFQRLPGMMALPKPERNGSIDSFIDLLNLSDRDDAAILLAFCIHSLQPKGAFPILVLIGPKGSSKSTISKVVTKLIDPNIDPLRPFPRNEQDLAIALNSRHLAAFDNISCISQARSDALARIATGGSFSTRKLYSDLDQISIPLGNPLILNGIHHFVNQPDLEDRCLFIKLQEIDNQRRMTDREFWLKFDEIHPQVFGCLLDGMAKMLQERPYQEGLMLGRMADFHVNAIASESAFWQRGTFDAAYKRNKNLSRNLRLNQSPIATAIVNIVIKNGNDGDDANCRTERTVWTGSVEKLLYEIQSYSRDSLSLGLPDTVIKLGQMLANCDELLLEHGIKIYRTKAASKSRDRGYSIKLLAKN